MSASLFSSSSFVVVHDGSSVLGIAERSRRTGLAFANGVGSGWGAADLFQWMGGPYLRAIHLPSDVDADAWSLASGSSVGLAEEMLAARASVVAFVRYLATLPPRAPFVESAVERGLVLPCESDDGTGWIATWKRGAEARHLVAALFVVDFLVRPVEYRELLSVCPTCGALLFDWGSRMRGNCGMHDPPALPLARHTPRLVERRGTLSGLGQDACREHSQVTRVVNR